VTSSATFSVCAGVRSPREVISLAARWHLRSGLSYRGVGELLAGRGITADHLTIDRRVPRFTPGVPRGRPPRPPLLPVAARRRVIRSHR
jgi:transposase-like protein